MSFNLKCPICLNDFDYRKATKDQALLQVIRMQAEFAPHSRLVFEYAELFETTRPVKPLKLVRVLLEVLEIWKAGQFALNKQVYRISKEGMAQAFKTVCNKNLKALDNHNYLKKVMVSIAEEEGKKRSAAEEKALKEREARIRATAPPENLTHIKAPMAMSDALKKMPWAKGEKDESKLD